MTRQSREEWMRDVSARQRNLVFPNTVNNEARFWRNVIAGKQGLSIGQAIGLGLICFTTLPVIWLAIRTKLEGPRASGSVLDRLLASFGDWKILFGIFGVLFLLLRWRTRRALSKAEDLRRRGNVSAARLLRLNDVISHLGGIIYA
jgi:hypothetical protein